MKTFCVRPKIAGIESRANRTSVPPIAHHHQQHRGHRLLAVPDREQLVAVVVVGGVEDLPGQSDDDVVGGVGLFAALGFEHVAGGQ